MDGAPSVREKAGGRRSPSLHRPQVGHLQEPTHSIPLLAAQPRGTLHTGPSGSATWWAEGGSPSFLGPAAAQLGRHLEAPVPRLLLCRHTGLVPCTCVSCHHRRTACPAPCHHMFHLPGDCALARPAAMCPGPAAEHPHACPRGRAPVSLQGRQRAASPTVTPAEVPLLCSQRAAEASCPLWTETDHSRGTDRNGPHLSPTNSG